MADPALESAVGDVLATLKEMDRAGLTEGTAGNVSARTDDGRVVLSPTALPYAEMTAADLVVTDLGGRVLLGGASEAGRQAVLENI